MEVLEQREQEGRAQLGQLEYQGKPEQQVQRAQMELQVQLGTLGR
jgi:hypothetical protein